MLDRRGINGARSTGKFSRIPRLPSTRETYEQRWEKTCHDWGNKWLSWKNKQTNNSKDLEIYVSKGRKESKKLENYRDVRPWSTLKLANFPIFFSASSSPGSLDLSIPFRELWVVREMRPTCAIKKHERGGRVATIWDTFTSGAGFFAGYARQNRWAKLGQVLCVSGHRCDWYERSKGIWSRSSPLTLFITNFSLFFFLWN